MEKGRFRMTKFNIGDTVYRACAGHKQIWVVCPECLGSGRLRVILGDNSEVSIACVCCERGYEGSPGRMQTYAFRSEVQESEIVGIESEMRDGTLQTKYKVNGCYVVDEKDLFTFREDAQGRAAELVLEHEAEEAKRLKYKEKQTKIWAWNVSYWRREIKRAEEQIARCEARLAVAPKNVKGI
jgi:hypothetical protein